MACTVSGSTTVGLHRQCPSVPTWTSVPTLAQVRSSSSMNSGVPSDRSTIAATSVERRTEQRVDEGAGVRGRQRQVEVVGVAPGRIGLQQARARRGHDEPSVPGRRAAGVVEEGEQVGAAQWTSSTSHVSASGAQGIDGCQPGVEAGVPLGGEIPGRDRARGHVRAKQPADFLNDHLGARSRDSRSGQRRSQVLCAIAPISWAMVSKVRGRLRPPGREARCRR